MINQMIFIILGAALLIDGACAGFSANFNIGVILEFLLGALCLVSGIFYDKIKKWLKAAVIAGLLIILCGCLSLWIYGAHDTVDYKEDILIVLGAGVHGETPTNPLVKRLDAAVEYLNKNKKSYVIVTGGQGPQEDVTEAFAMEKYLIENGISADRIIKEEQATSTSENYSYSKEIIDERFANASIAVITNDFHIYRSKKLAHIAGIEVSTLHADTPASGRVSMYFRELLAVLKLWILKY